MAEEQLEAKQRALRRTDYDSLSDGEEDSNALTNFPDSSPAPSSQIRQRGRPVPNQPQPTSTFDPYAPANIANNTSFQLHTNPPQNSLMDDISVEMSPIEDERRASSSGIPGAAGYLEMEGSPPRESHPTPINMLENEPITTSSGLMLTHRRSPANTPNPAIFDNGTFRNVQKDYFEVENNYFNSKSPYERKNTMVMVQVRRFMSYVKIWVAISAIFLLAATGVFFHSFGHSNKSGDTQVKSDAQQQDTAAYTVYQANEPQQIILRPMENISELAKGEKQHRHIQEETPSMLLSFHHKQQQQHGVGHVILNLRDEFESWVQHHGKTYHSHEEKEHRFSIWTQNHHRTIEKNRRHGLCKLTKQEVFGSNGFKDLSPEEFKSKFLTGYKGPKTDDIPTEASPNVRQMSNGQVLNPRVHKVEYHESVKQRMMLQQQQPFMTSSSLNCDWYDVSCLLRWLWQTSGIQFGSFIGTMEPAYDASSFPNAVDWRDSGAVTDIRKQGDCGACWAITAVETAESAHYISTGNLYNLAESEIITCDETCEMCDGGWPQNAFEWIMDNGGLPLQSYFPYDGSTLYAMTQGIAGNSNTWTEDLVKQYRQQVCPAENGSRDSRDSQEYYDNGEQNSNYGDYSDKGRYGNIKGYGYATDRCICYSDGSGCDCDDQNEDMAVANMATYGPAVVCLEASLWQDYSGGIITSELGCGSGFMDMNHCVQAVGYRFTDGTNSGEDGDDDGSGKSGSEDSSAKREGYWIIRNQWGSYWGMNGYAYVAMGENTCGVLNDMTQAYL